MKTNIASPHSSQPAIQPTKPLLLPELVGLTAWLACSLRAWLTRCVVVAWLAETWVQPGKWTYKHKLISLVCMYYIPACIRTEPLFDNFLLSFYTSHKVLIALTELGAVRDGNDIFFKKQISNVFLLLLVFIYCTVTCRLLSNESSCCIYLVILKVPHLLLLLARENINLLSDCGLHDTRLDQ